MLRPLQGDNGSPGVPGAPGMDGHPVRCLTVRQMCHKQTFACLSALILRSVFLSQGLTGPRGLKVIKCLRSRSGAVFFSDAFALSRSESAELHRPPFKTLLPPSCCASKNNHDTAQTGAHSVSPNSQTLFCTYSCETNN